MEQLCVQRQDQVVPDLGHVCPCVRCGVCEPTECSACHVLCVQSTCVLWECVGTRVLVTWPVCCAGGCTILLCPCPLAVVFPGSFLVACVWWCRG